MPFYMLSKNVVG